MMLCDIVSLTGHRKEYYGKKITHSAQPKKNTVGTKIRKKTSATQGSRRLGGATETAEKCFSGTDPQPLLHNRTVTRVYPCVRLITDMCAGTGTKRVHTRIKEIIMVMVTDSIADLITRIKNAGMVRKEKIEMPYSKKRNSIAQKLRVANYIDNVETQGHGIKKQLIITLAYNEEGKHKVKDVKRISKPGRRVYVGVQDIRPIRNNHGTLFLSTPKGILTGDEARKGHVGGEALFSIW